MEYLKTFRVLFSKKTHLSPNLGKNCPKWRQSVLDFLKNFVTSFPGNNLKWKLLLLLIFHHQSHIWQNSGSREWAEMLLANQTAGFFNISQGRNEWWILFSACRETGKFSTNWFYHFGFAQPGIPKHLK